MARLLLRLRALRLALLGAAALTACDAYQPQLPRPECLRTSDCAPGLVCTPAGTCAVECTTDADCAGGTCASGRCEGTCPPGQVRCGALCVDPLTDRQRCGASGACAGAEDGTACLAGEICSNGACALSCQVGLVDCDGRCIDPEKDPEHCGASASCAGGAAGAACGSAQVCSAGACSNEPCPAGLVACGGRCVDPLVDRAFCGAAPGCAGPSAGTVCPSGEVCASGACALSCPVGQLACAGKCVDPSTDRVHCGAAGGCEGGAAGASCAPGELCAAGSCATSCPQGQLACAGKCVDPLTDRLHCGATATCAGADAGASCPQVCAGGVCSEVCPTGFVECGGSCVDPDVDPAHCGAAGDCAGANAGDSCAADEVCSGGACTVSCPSGQIACGGRCADPLTDRIFCGASPPCSATAAGEACPAGEVCSLGLCAVECQSGLVACGGRCVDPASSPAHCGATGDCAGPNAGVACGGGEVCADGTCGYACPADQLDCGGRCVDPATDRMFCGASGDCSGAGAGAVCAAGTWCQGGACLGTCPAGQLVCGNRCVDPETDRAYCGASAACTGGTSCGAGTLCSAGACIPTCAAPLVACGGTCVDPRYDPAHCGAFGACTGASAGSTCAASKFCWLGTCSSIVCGSGLTDCAGTCTNLQTSATSCGGCGVACTGGATCVAGDCRAPACTGILGFPQPPALIPASPYMGVNPMQSVATDLDGDGKTDLAWADWDNGVIGVAFGRGDGTFSRYSFTSAGAEARFLATADLNADGKPDLVLGLTGGTAVYLNDGVGTFTLKSSLGTSGGRVAIADFNTDGKPDLAIGNSYTSISIRLGVGDGTFGAATTVPVGSGPMVATDVTGDGKVDLVVALSDGYLHVVPGAGNGTFAAEVRSPVPTSPVALAVADLNGDGRRDVLVARYNQDIGVMLAGGAVGAFGAYQTVSTTSLLDESLALHDVTGDGKPDAVIHGAGAVVVMPGNGTGGFGAASRYASGLRKRSEIAIGNFDAGTTPDLAYVTDNLPGGAAHAVLNLGGGAYGSPPIVSLADGWYGGGATYDIPVVHVGDVNGDGKLDLGAIVQWENAVKIALGRGDGTFDAPQTAFSTTAATAFALGDLDGDGKLDVVMGENGSPYAVYSVLNNGTWTGATARKYDFPSGRAPAVLQLADATGEGKLDLLALDEASGYLSLLPGNGDGSFGARVEAYVGGIGLKALVAADLNGDGKADVVVGGGSGVFVLLSNGDGTWVSASTTLRAVEAVALADLNGDGQLDVVAAERSQMKGLVLLNRGDGALLAPVTYPLKAYPSAVTAGDFDGDGLVDVGWGLGSSGAFELRRGTGAGALATASSFYPIGDSRLLATGDFDQDGRPDVATASATVLRVGLTRCR